MRDIFDGKRRLHHRNINFLKEYYSGIIRYVNIRGGMKSLKTIFKFVLFTFLAGVMTACAQTAATGGQTGAATAGPATTAPTIAPTAAPVMMATPLLKTYANPFAYCTAMGNQDEINAAYTGPQPPVEVIQALKKAYNAPADMPDELYQKGSFWRCMDKKVYACFVGANLPCDSKANVDKTPTSAEKDFCAEHPGSDFIPASVTGHDTIYEWTCNGDTPEINSQLFRVDDRGYIAEIWYVVEPSPSN